MRTEYVSDDGRRFSTKKECEEYEEKTLSVIKTLANKITGTNQSDEERIMYTLETFMRDIDYGTELLISDYINYLYENCDVLFIHENLTQAERYMIPHYDGFPYYIRGEYHYLPNEDRFISKEEMLKEFVEKFCSEWKVSTKEIETLLSTL